MKHYKNGSPDIRGLLLRLFVQGRNGYYGIDEYTVSQDRSEPGHGSMMRNVDCFKTRKQAELTAGHIGGAYQRGWADAVGTWPTFPTEEKAGDVSLYRLSCPVHHSIDPGSTYKEAEQSAEQHKCEFCQTIARVIETASRLRSLARGLLEQVQTYDQTRGRYSN